MAPRPVTAITVGDIVARYSMGKGAIFGIIGSVSVRERLVEDLASLLVSCLKLAPPSPPLSANERLFGGRLGLDSVDAAQWVATVERRFAIEIPDEALTRGALESLGNLADTLILQGICTGPGAK
jgi:acyl carrier protein